MTDVEIREKLEAFVDEIFYGVKTVEEAKALEKKLNDFCTNNGVTYEQRAILRESGAGEELYMMVS